MIYSIATGEVTKTLLGFHRQKLEDSLVPNYLITLDCVGSSIFFHLSLNFSSLVKKAPVWERLVQKESKME